MDARRPGSRRRRRSTGFVVRIKGNALFTRCLEELELHLSPRRAGLALATALAGIGAEPETVTLGHLVRAVDLTLVPALREHCGAEEAAAVAGALAQVLDHLAATFFPR